MLPADTSVTTRSEFLACGPRISSTPPCEPTVTQTDPAKDPNSSKTEEAGTFSEKSPTAGENVPASTVVDKVDSAEKDDLSSPFYRTTLRPVVLRHRLRTQRGFCQRCPEILAAGK